MMNVGYIVVMEKMLFLFLLLSTSIIIMMKSHKEKERREDYQTDKWKKLRFETNGNERTKDYQIL